MTTTEPVDTSPQESPIQRVRNRIQEGRSGKNLGISFSLKQIDKVLYGIQQARYYLIGADSGVGKTSLGDFLFILRGWITAKAQGRSFKCKYYSFEISEEEKIAKWICFVVKYMHDMDLNVDYVMGRIEGMTVTDEDQILIDQALDFIAELLHDVTIIDTPKNPTAIFHDVIEYAESVGTVHRKSVTSKKKDKNGKFPVTQYITGYTPNDPDAIFLIALDHVALCISEQGLNAKETIDLVSKYAVFTRNKFRFSWLIIQQFNTELQSVERRKLRNAALAPARNDFGDSKYTYRDADAVFGLINPSMFDVAEFYGYSILEGKENSHNYYFGSYFIGVFLMKNRYGRGGLFFPVLMNGMAGTFTDLPPSTPDNEFALEVHAEECSRLNTINEWYSPKNL